MGLLFVGLGLLVYLFESTSFKIPGDIIIKKPGVTVFIPIGTSILISVLLTLLLNLIFRVRK